MFDLSVIVPVYNVLPYLNRCIESIVRACSRKGVSLSVEIVCVDDGSTDGSGSFLDCLCQKLSKETKKIRMIVLHQNNAGVSVARNSALEKATGRWIAFIDSDDMWQEDILLRLQSFMTVDSPYELIAFAAHRVDEAGVDKGLYIGPCPNGCVTGDQILAGCRGPLSRYLWSIWDKFYLHSRIESLNLRFVDGMRLSEDSLFNQIFLAYAECVWMASDTVGYLYMIRAGSAVSNLETSLPKRPFYHFEILFEHWLKTHKQFGLKLRLNQIAASSPLLGREHFYKEGLRGEAIEIILASRVFNRKILPFMFFNGNFKQRVFAVIYGLAPKSIKRNILNRL